MIAVTMVPHNVERGMLRSGSMTFSAGTVADSSPSSGQRVRIAAGVIAEIVNGCASTLISDDASARPSSTIARMITASSGMSLSTVVTSWNTPTCFTPRPLTYVRMQHTASGVSAGPPLIVLIAGTSSDRYATLPIAIAALPTHNDIQSPHANTKPQH